MQGAVRAAAAPGDPYGTEARRGMSGARARTDDAAPSLAAGLSSFYLIRGGNNDGTGNGSDSGNTASDVSPHHLTQRHAQQQQQQQQPGYGAPTQCTDVLADVTGALVLQELATTASSPAVQGRSQVQAQAQAAHAGSADRAGDMDSEAVDRLERSLKAVSRQLRDERRRAFSGVAVLKERDAELARLRDEVSTLRQSHVSLQAKAKVCSGRLALCGACGSMRGSPGSTAHSPLSTGVAGVRGRQPV